MANSTSAASLTSPVAGLAPRPVIDGRVVGTAAALFALGTVYLNQAVHTRQAALFLVGGVLGLFLYHAAFGFTSAWRVFISDRRGAGLRAQMLMLAVVCALFFPVLGSGTPIFTESIRGNVNPLGVPILVGAFLFGLGMQLGSGCASGTLFTVGGGNARMVITLTAFIVGSAIGAAHAPWWQSMPQLEPVSLVESFGPLTGLVISLSALGAIAYGTAVAERRRHGRLVPERRPAHEGWPRWLRGPWPLVVGAIGLALANFATLALAGRPWGVTSAFALWGSKAADVIGFEPAAWAYWASASRAAELEGSVFEHITSVMDFGIILGAMTAAGLAGRFKPVWTIPMKSLVAAIAGGLLLGYGARLAYGCNIGAFFSGVASGSLHGWLWLVAAFAGSVLGTRLRPAFGMIVERTKAAGC